MIADRDALLLALVANASTSAHMSDADAAKAVHVAQYLAATACGAWGHVEDFTATYAAGRTCARCGVTMAPASPRPAVHLPPDD